MLNFGPDLAALLKSAVAQHQAGRIAEAESLYRRILAHDPHHADALHLLGVIAYAAGKHEDAVALIEKARTLLPNFPDLHLNLGNAQRDAGRLADAIASYLRALELRPGYAKALSNLGIAYRFRGELGASLAACRAAVAADPNFADAHTNLGNTLRDQSLFVEAIAAYRQAAALAPNDPFILSNLGQARCDAGDFDAGLATFRAALALAPDAPGLLSNLASALKAVGEVDQALATFRLALAGPCPVDVADNYLFTLHGSPVATPQEIAAEHMRWRERFADPLKQFHKACVYDPSPGRRLRIGYVSPDLCGHVVAKFLIPILAHRNKAAFEVFAYAQVPRPDVVTEHIRSLVDHWRSSVGLTDHQLADMIRADSIDILIDLAGHTAGNRLLTFALKPAPVQVTWLGYPNTTGLATIDCRITDALADPPELRGEDLCSEELVRLPHSAWCFQPMGAPPVGPRPPEGPITFGSFSNLFKFNPPMLAVWARILRAVPDARLLIKARAAGSVAAQTPILRALAAGGVDGARVEFLGWRPTQTEHLADYARVDIALDTFPYHGTTTTCEALWQGVPVVTRAGSVHVSRVGVSLLTSAGLPELIAGDDDQYVAIAAGLAGDRAGLARLRSTLRDSLVSSPLFNAPLIAGDLENALRQAWREHCAH